MKLVAGVVLAGAVAGGAIAVVNGSSDPLPAEKPPKGETKTGKYGTYSTSETVYKRITLAGCGQTGYQDGPSRGSLMMSANPAPDDAGNVYWMERGGYAVMRRYDPKTGRVSTFAGGAMGLLDGPLDVARFTSAGYMTCDYARISRDGRWMWVVDPGHGGLLRLIDMEKKTVSTIPPGKIKGVTSIIVDGKGACYAATWPAILRVTPEGKVEKLNLESRPKDTQYAGSFSAHFLALDEKNGELYGMVREGKDRFWSWNLATGKFTVRMNSGPGKWAQGPFRNSRQAGPIKGMAFHCPSGVSIRPGEEGKTFYWGGGDDPTFYRVNLAGGYYDGLFPIGSERFVFGCSKPGMTYGHVCTWAGAPQWDSNGNIYTTWGIWPKLISFRPEK